MRFVQLAIFKWVACEVWNELRRGLGLSGNLKKIRTSDRLPRIIKEQGMKVSVAHRSMSLLLEGNGSGKSDLHGSKVSLPGKQ